MFLKCMCVFEFLNYFIQRLFHFLSTEHWAVQLEVLREESRWGKSGQTSWRRKHLLQFGQWRWGGVYSWRQKLHHK